jgi:hypothetical protein
MAKIEMDVETKLLPDKVIEALTDFSDRRPEIWRGISREFYEVYSVGETSADIREGQTKPVRVWGKEHYDWSKPGNVTWTVTESNFSRPGSYVSADVTPRPEGGSHVHITWERWGSNLKGRFVVAILKATKGGPIPKYMKKTLDGLAEQAT